MKRFFNVFYKHDLEKTDEEFRTIKKRVKDFKHKLEIQLSDYEQVNNLSDYDKANLSDIQFVKNEWVKLPEAIGNGVLSMGLEESEKRKAFLVHYEPNSELFPHIHPNNIERIQVLTGCIKDNTTGKEINEGNSYTIEKNIPHHIVTMDVEAYLFIVFSEEMNTLQFNHLISNNK